MTGNTTTKPISFNKKTVAESLGISVQAFDKWGVNPVDRSGREVFFTIRDIVANRVKNEVEKGKRYRSCGEPCSKSKQGVS